MEMSTPEPLISKSLFIDRETGVWPCESCRLWQGYDALSALLLSPLDSFRFSFDNAELSPL